MPRDAAAVIVSTATVRRALLVLLALAALAGAAFYGRALVSRPPAAADQIDRNAYQIVYINSGQAFIGKLTIVDADTYLLNDVFYLAPSDTGQASRVVKRGSEILGPGEPMVILGRQVLFFENMRPDSEVATAIRQLKSGQGGPVPTIAPTAPTASARPSASR